MLLLRNHLAYIARLGFRTNNRCNTLTSSLNPISGPEDPYPIALIPADARVKLFHDFCSIDCKVQRFSQEKLCADLVLVLLSFIGVHSFK